MEQQLVTARKERCRISHPFATNVLGHLPAGNRPDHGADVGQRAERRELQRAINIVRPEEPQDPGESRQPGAVVKSIRYSWDSPPRWRV